MISRRPVVAPPTERYDRRYYDYEEPRRRRRPFWPWLLAVLLLAGALVGGFFVWNELQDQLSESELVGVPFVEGQRWPRARENVLQEGLRPIRVPRSHDSVPVGIVFRQNPDAGERVPKGNAVRIFVSTGKPRVAVPDVLGAREADAVVTIRAAGLVPDPHDIFSDKTAGTVIAQDPVGGTSVVKGSTVRVNISKGQQHRGIPSVLGLSFADASRQLRGAGFTPIRDDIDDPAPRGTVVAQDPGPGTLHPPGTEVTLSVSTGQETTTVPDVLGEDEETARTTLENDGWVVAVQDTGTDNPDEDGRVLSQTPGPGEQAKPGARVTIYIGRLESVEPPPGPPPPPPPAPGQ
jgi:eukaryotic-like serine/threonine-protein kinase